MKYTGEIITSIDKLIELSNDKKAVVFNGTPPKAAAFFIGMPVRTVQMYIKREMLRTYIKQSK